MDRLPSNLPIDGHSRSPGRGSDRTGATAALERGGEGADCRGEPGAGRGGERDRAAPRAASQPALRLAAGAARRRRTSGGRRRRCRSDFVPVVVTEEACRFRRCGDRDRGRRARVVRVSPGVDLAFLADVLRTLKAARMIVPPAGCGCWSRRGRSTSAAAPTAWRRSVQTVLRQDPFSGTVFVFRCEARRPGEAARLGRQRPGADLEAAGERRVQVAAGQRRGDAAVGGAARRLVRRARLVAGARAADRPAEGGTVSCDGLTRRCDKSSGKRAGIVVKSPRDDDGLDAPSRRSLPACARGAGDARRTRGRARRAARAWRIRTSGCATSSASCSGCSSAGARRSSTPTSSSSPSRISNRRSPKPRPKQEKADPALRRARGRERRPSRGVAARASAADRGGDRARDTACPCCGGAMHVIGEDRSRAARRHPGAVPGPRHPPAEICLPRLPGRGGAGAGAGAADRGRPADRAAGGAGAGGKYADHCPLYRQAQILRATGHRDRPLDAGLLGRLCRGRAEAAVAADARGAAALGQAVRRRDHGAGARSRPRAHQDRLLLGDRPRRPAWRRRRSAGGGLQLRAGARRRARGGAARRASPASCRPTAMPPTSSWPIPSARGGAGQSSPICWAHCRRRFFEIAKSGAGADRRRGAAADRRALRDRGRDPRQERRRAPGGAPGSRPSRSSRR